MYKIIGGDQKEYGPVTVDELRRWIAEGRLNAKSLARAEGAAEWKPLAEFPEFAEALGVRVAPPPPLSALAAPVNAEAWSAEILARQPEVGIGRCLALSWDLLRANFGLLVGAAFLAWLIGTVCQFIPLVGGFLYWAISGVLYGGLYLVFLNRIRGQPASVGEVFAGFQRNPAQLLLVGLVTSILTKVGLACCLILPGLYLYIAWIFSVPLVADQRLEFWSAMELSRKVVTRVWFEMLLLVFLAFLPFVLANILVQIKVSIAVFPLVRDILTSGQPPDPGKLMDMAMGIARSSFVYALLLKVVLFLNLPFAVGALMYAYESLFGARTAPRA